MQSEHLVHYQSNSGLIEEQKIWAFVQFQHSLEEIMQTRLLMPAVISMVYLSQTKNLMVGGQSGKETVCRHGLIN